MWDAQNVWDWYFLLRISSLHWDLRTLVCRKQRGLIGLWAQMQTGMPLTNTAIKYMLSAVLFLSVWACGLCTHQQRPLISVVPSCAGSAAAGCCWSAAPASEAPGWAAPRAAARLGSTSWTGSEQRSPQWQTRLTGATGSCCRSSERCRPPAGAANTRRSRCPGRWQNPRTQIYMHPRLHVRASWCHGGVIVIFLGINDGKQGKGTDG